MAQAPVVTSLDRGQYQSYLNFMAELRRDNVTIAMRESDRLKPYLGALSATLREDIAAAHGHLDTQTTERLERLADPDTLHTLFRKVAETTKNTILTEFVVVPQSLLQESDYKNIGDTYFGGDVKYDGRNFTLAFIQVFEKDDDNKKKSSTSVPVFALDSDMLDVIAPHGSEKLLRALQTVTTAGNHDMLHHYTNTTLNTDIANSVRTSKFPLETSIEKWSDNFGYGDTQAHSYESWLMLNHARVRQKLEDGPEGEELRAACDTFFDELTRIGQEMKEADNPKAQEAINYIGTVTCFMMGRFLPLDHSLMEHALTRLEQATPNPQNTMDNAQSILFRAHRMTDPESPDYDKRAHSALENYWVKRGSKLLQATRNIDKEGLSYQDIKKLELVMIAPWSMDLMSPGILGTDLREKQDRTGRINYEMIHAAAGQVSYNPVDGMRTFTNKGGDTVEVHYKNGRLHNDNGPAISVQQKDGTKNEHWLENGILKRSITHYSTGLRTEEWFDENGRLHRDDGPAYITTNTDGERTEEWSQHGTLHRVGGPAQETTGPGGCYERKWFQNGKEHRDDGPSTEKFIASGTRIERWCQNGALHRKDGPAQTKEYRNGSKTVEWFLDGQPHREDGPAVISIYEDGSSTETWMRNGQFHREDGPAVIVKDSDGNITSEEWYVEDKLHRDDGPAEIKRNKDGVVLRETWRLHGELHREDGPAQTLRDKNGHIGAEEWWRHGELQRETLREWNDNGTLLAERHFQNGQLHREDGPSLRRWNDDGTLTHEQWHQNGQYHRDDGPSFRLWNIDGTLTVEEWKRNGQLHREDGPSYSTWDENGKLLVEQQHLNGRLKRDDSTYEDTHAVHRKSFKESFDLAATKGTVKKRKITRSPVW
ncbi:MAG: hypothetical protein OXT65_08375 [Alphaproteobacteria bacterium]|nr:hypothetical protein [Alphaproteobacteria bacterium]